MIANAREIHRKINERVSEGVATKFVTSLLDTIFHDSSSIPVYSFFWDEVSSHLVDKITKSANELSQLYHLSNFEYLKVITKRIKVDYFKDKLAITISTKGLISDDYRSALEIIFIECDLRVEFPKKDMCIITLR